MEFAELVDKIVNITGLTHEQATRLMAINLFMLSGQSIELAVIETDIPLEAANLMIEFGRDSVARSLESMLEA